MTDRKEKIDLFGSVSQRDIGEEMKDSYINYAMSVIVGRALPDARDGLKPVHRRILYTMYQMGLKKTKPFKKSARVVGDVLGKFHPHGDTSVYDALVRMVQNFSLRYPLVQGQGNFGSIDGDPPAAMRYTEVRLESISDDILCDIEKQTVRFSPNYDGSLTEPAILPSKIPTLLVNGSSGIAVGMATNIPTHNLGEVCDGAIELIKNPDIEVKDLMKIIKGPDFPTGAIVMGKKGIMDYFETGRGSVRVKAVTSIESIKGGKEAIIVTEIPYQVNKTSLIESMVKLVRDKKITDISDIRDESDRRGMRLVIEVKRDGNAQVVLNQLSKHTQLETTFGVIMLALVDGKPRVLPVKEVISEYIKHRKDIITKRTEYDLQKARAREHILQGLLIALDNLDAVVKTIRQSKDAEQAKSELISKFKLTPVQAQAILDMRLHQLTQLESDAISKECEELAKLIKQLTAILASPQKIMGIITEELTEIKTKYPSKRKTQISSSFSEFDMEDLIPLEDVVITLSHSGYVKRIGLDTYKAQNRGGKGIIGGETKDEDFIESLFVTKSHATILFFTTKGKVYALKAYEIPEGSRISRGKAIINLLQITKEEKITSAIAIDSFEIGKSKRKNKEKSVEPSGKYLLMCTRNGLVKRTSLDSFKHIRISGIAAIKLEEGDILVQVQLTGGTSDIIIGTEKGKSIRFAETEVRNMGRTAMGVRGIRLAKGDIVVGAESIDPASKPTVLTVCEKGYGKRTELEEYRKQHRGGSGIITIKTSSRNGNVVGIKLVTPSEDLMIISEYGKMIRLRCEQIREVGRNTQGVRLVRLNESDKVASVAPVVSEEKQAEIAGK